MLAIEALVLREDLFGREAVTVVQAVEQVRMGADIGGIDIEL